ncbi:MAG: BlaI/MecI/CopY family transcriptional regulator [Acidimicrobiales bacterium]
MTKRVRRRGDGELEADVLTILWAADTALTPAEVSDALATDLAYTTIMTVLTRLWKKGLAERVQQGRGYAYRVIVSETELATRRLNDTLDTVTDRNSLLAGFVDSLSGDDQQRLRAILDNLEQQ